MGSRMDALIMAVILGAGVDGMRERLPHGLIWVGKKRGRRPEPGTVRHLKESDGYVRIGRQWWRR